MICFNCGVKLHKGEENGCQACGVKFAGKCPSCEFPYPLMAKYCVNCGMKLVSLDAASSVHNFDVLSESRHNVAVIFADISGFTALSERMDPEEVREMINDCFDYITRPVYKLEGTIDKYIGDCVMILFGAKYIHSDDAKRAMLCVTKMMQLIGEFSEERLASGGFALTLSIGVNYGLVVTGSVGNYFDKDYTVMGDIVNTAQRLQASAEKGTILVSESVYTETKDIVSYSKAREISVKNKENPIKCYSVESLNTRYSLERKMVFVSREREIALLNSIYNHTLNKNTRCVTVTGEAGIGKTRLLEEFVSRIGTDVKKIWVDCSALYQNRVYFVISCILMKIMNIEAQDSANIKRNRLISFLEYILESLNEDEIKRNFNFLSLILGLDRDNEFQNLLNSMNFENIRREILKQLSIFFTNLGAKNRYIIVIDDSHWADENSTSIMNELIEMLPELNIIFIFTSRLEVEKAKSDARGRYHYIRLGAISEKGTLLLGSKMLGCKKIDGDLYNAIVRFTKGNPLYIYEFISSIKRSDKYFISGDTAYIEKCGFTTLPNNIQSLMLSNVQQLDDFSRNALQAAAVIGKDFSLSMVNCLLENGMEAEAFLNVPVHLNLISFKSVLTYSGLIDKVYSFNHDIEREVIYDSILNKKRKELHRKLGDYIESSYYKELENYYEVLCMHYYKAGMDKKAAEYHYKTALKYKGDFNFINALDHFESFLELSGNKDSIDKELKVINTYRDMGYINFVAANYEQALDCFNKALQGAYLSDDICSVKIMVADVYKEQGMYDKALDILDGIQRKMKQDDGMYGKLLQMKCSILRIIGNPDALNFAKRSERILLKVKDYSNLSETLNQAGLAYFVKGDVNNALYYMNKSYSYAEKINNLEVMAKVSGNLGIICHDTGMISKALEFYGKSMDLADKISDPQGNISGCINLGILYMDKGLFNKAENLFNKALTISHEVSSRLNECICLTNLGDIMCERGFSREALEFYGKSIEIARELNIPVEEGINSLGLVKVYIGKGEYDKAEGLMDIAFKAFDHANEIACLSDYYVCLGTYYLSINKTGEALQCCEKAAAISKECKSDRKMLNALRLKGEILSFTEDYENAAKVFDSAVIIAEQVESDYAAARCYFGKYMALSRLQKHEEAGQSLEKAKESIDKVDGCALKSLILHRD